jgi:hypothetical protein
MEATVDGAIESAALVSGGATKAADLSPEMSAIMAELQAELHRAEATARSFIKLYPRPCALPNSLLPDDPTYEEYYSMRAVVWKKVQALRRKSPRRNSKSKS